MKKITPDIVCKMSMYDMRCVGLYDRTDIMKIRIACVPYRSTQPTVQGGFSMADNENNNNDSSIFHMFLLSQSAVMESLNKSDSDGTIYAAIIK